MRFLLIAALSMASNTAFAAPTAEVAKKCMSYAYKAYPYKRPGSVKGSPDRQNYMRDCVARNGDVPLPSPVNGKS